MVVLRAPSEAFVVAVIVHQRRVIDGKTRMWVVGPLGVIQLDLKHIAPHIPQIYNNSSSWRTN
jgi:hypothetical protein